MIHSSGRLFNFLHVCVCVINSFIRNIIILVVCVCCCYNTDSILGHNMQLWALGLAESGIKNRSKMA